MTEGNFIEFETVQRRFGEASDALSELRDLLRRLAGIKEEQELTKMAISDASESLRVTSDSVASFCDVLRSALDSTLEALENTKNLATGAELTAIRSGVDGTRDLVVDLAGQKEVLDTKLEEFADGQGSIVSAVDAIGGRVKGNIVEVQEALGGKLAELGDGLGSIGNAVDAVRGRIDGELSEVRHALDSTRSELVQANDRLSMIEGRLANLPARIRRKYNLDDLFSDGQTVPQWAR